MIIRSIKILYGFHLDVFVLSPSSLPRSSSLPSTVLFKLKQSPARSAGSYLPTFKFKKIWTMYYNMSASKGLDPVLPKPHLNYRLGSFNSERKAEFPLCHPLYKIKHICPKPFQNPLISSSADLPNFVDALSIQLPSQHQPLHSALNGRGCRVASMFVHSTSTPSQHQPLHFGAKWKRMPGREATRQPLVHFYRRAGA
jgi:hypothetical protein